MDSAYNWIGFFWVSGLVLVAAFLLAPRRWPRWLRNLVFLAVFVRIIGSVLRYEMIFQVYGRGDAIRYYEKGLRYAEYIHAFDGQMFTAAVRGSARWWGTPFVDYVSGFVLALIGPSMRGAFVVFSMLPLVGLLLIALAFLRAFPTGSWRRYTTLLLLWPSLVFWPSSMGKESIILLGIGIATYAYVGNGGRPRLLLLALGLLCIGCIRPHVAMMVAVALGAAEWLAGVRAWTAARVARGLLLAVVAVMAVRLSLAQFGLELTELDEIQGFIEFHAGQTVKGGSLLTPVSGALALPMAFVNVLARPLPFEARNPMMLIAATEVVLLWVVAWRRRRLLAGVFREWREHRVLLFVVPLTLVLIFFYGAFVSNLGIIARQRVVVLPFLFLLLEAVPTVLPQRVAGRRVSQRGPSFGARGREGTVRVPGPWRRSP